MAASRIRSSVSKMLDGMKESYILTLKTREIITHDVYKFTFSLPNPKQHLGLPLGCCLLMKNDVDSQAVKRPYTPVHVDATTKGVCEFVIKVYRGDTDKNIPGGKMSQHLENLQEGDEINVSGPMGKVRVSIESPKEVKFKIFQTYKYTDFTEVSTRNVCMIAGGTGITPMFQLIQEILRHEDNAINISLIYSNKSTDDILLKEELGQLDEECERFHLWHTVSRQTEFEDWKYGIGRVDVKMISDNFSKFDKPLVLLCGPPPMTESMVKNLKQLDYSDEQIIKF